MENKSIIQGVGYPHLHSALSAYAEKYRVFTRCSEDCTMTNNPTIDGLDRETLAFALGFKCHGHKNRTDQHADKQNALDKIRALLDAPAVERQELKPAVRVCGAGYDAERNTVWMETGVVEMPIMRKVEVGEELVFLSEAQSTTARLEARIAELESGRGEPVAWKFKERVWATGLSDYVWRDQLEDEKPNGDERQIRDIDPLFTAPPAPVAVVLPDRKDGNGPALSNHRSYNQGWNACLDATAALNNKNK